MPEEASITLIKYEGKLGKRGVTYRIRLGRWEFGSVVERRIERRVEYCKSGCTVRGHVLIVALFRAAVVGGGKLGEGGG